MLFDITQRKRANKPCGIPRRSIIRWSKVCRKNILRKDLDGRFTFANGVFCRYMNRSVDGSSEKEIAICFPDSLAEKFRQDDRRVLACGQLFQNHRTKRSSDGEERFVEVIKTPLFNAERQPVGLQVIFWDVTERKRAEVRLEQVHRQLLETSRRAGMAEVANQRSS